MVNRAKRLVLMALACVLGTMAGIRTARPQIVLCKFVAGNGFGIMDMRNCQAVGDCGFSGCCLKYDCIGHPGFCLANKGQVCTLTYNCGDLPFACYNDCT